MVDAIISYAVQMLGDYHLNQAVLLVGVKEEVTWLQRELEYMQCFLKDAEEKQHSDQRICKWVSDIRDIAYDSLDVIDNFSIQETSSSLKRRFFGMYFRYKIAKGIEQLKKRIIDVSRRREIYCIRDINGVGEGGQTSKIERIRSLRQTSSFIDDRRKIVGLEDDFQFLVGKLAEKEQRILLVIISGMGGLGKTTLARKLFNSIAICERFDSRAWVCVSQEYKPKDVLRRVIKSFNSTITKKELDKLEDVEDMEQYLRNYLQGSKYLVVIDDVWKKEAWESLRMAFPDCNNGSRVIITTRHTQVAEVAYEKVFLHQLRFLRLHESWKLFHNTAFASNKANKALEKLGREMVEKCGGLPLAIIVLGGLLSRKKLQHEWKTVRDHLWKNLRINSLHIDSILSLSFNDLSPNLRLCFLFLGLYPEDYVIYSAHLIRLWMAEGFIPEDEETMEQIGEYYLKDLIDRNLLQVEESHLNRAVKCRVHDLLRDLAVNQGKDIKFLGIYDGKTSSTSSAFTYRRLAFHAKEGDTSSLARLNPCIRTLVIFGKIDYKCLKCICSRFKLLRVLDFEYRPSNFNGAYPSGIKNLVHLRYLRIQNISSGKLLPYISRLENLQTLVLQGNEILELYNEDVNDLIKILRSLRHLYIRMRPEFRVTNFRDLQSWGFKWDSYDTEWVSSQRTNCGGI